MLTPRLGAIGAAMALLLGSIVTETLVALATFRAVAAMPAGATLDPGAFDKKGRKRGAGNSASPV